MFVFIYGTNEQQSTFIQTTNFLRPIGLCAGEFVVPDDFDAPLPEDNFE
jgi:hypothetical protein